MIKEFRDHIHFCKKLFDSDEFKESSKYKIPNPSAEEKKDVEHLLEKLHAFQLLPNKLESISNNKNKHLNLREYKQKILSSGICPLNNAALGDLDTLLSFGIPVIPVKNILCDFIEFDLNEYSYNCIRREQKLEDKEYDPKGECIKDDEKTLCCEQSYNNADVLQILFKFYDNFPTIIYDKAKNQGRLPVFMYSYFIDNILFECVFGKEIFKKRFDINYPNEKIKREMAERSFRDVIDYKE